MIKNVNFNRAETHENPGWKSIAILVAGIIFVLVGLLTFVFHLDAIVVSGFVLGTSGIIFLIGMSCIYSYFKKWGNL